MIFWYTLLKKWSFIILLSLNLATLPISWKRSTASLPLNKMNSGSAVQSMSYNYNGKELQCLCPVSVNTILYFIIPYFPFICSQIWRKLYIVHIVLYHSTDKVKLKNITKLLNKATITDIMTSNHKIKYL